MTDEIKEVNVGLDARLEPCPFCGGDATLEHDNSIFTGCGFLDSKSYEGWRIECQGDCHAMTCWWHSETQAVAAWNRRTGPNGEALE